MGCIKIIEDGYFVYEYEIMIEDGNGIMWIIEDLFINFLDVMQSFFVRIQQVGNKKQVYFLMNMYGVKGFLIEIYFIDVKGKEMVDMFIKKFKIGD